MEMGDDWPGQTLHQTAIYDNSDLLQSLLEGEDKLYINAIDIWGRTPVYTAVSNNSIQCLKLLLKYDADPNISAGDRCGLMSPLHCAITDTKIEVILILLKHGASLNVIDKTGLTPLSLAHAIERRDIIQLIEDASDQQKKSEQQICQRLCTFCEKKDVAAAKTLLQKCKLNLHTLITNAPASGRLSPLCIACGIQNVELAKLLLDHCSASESLPPMDVTPLHIACQEKQLDMFKILLQKFPILCRQESSDHMIPSHIVAQNGCLEILRYILEFTYPESVLEEYNRTDAHCSYLAPFDVNAVTGDGRTMLYLATETGHLDVVEYLLNFSVKATKYSSAENNQECGDSRSEDVFVFKPVKVDVAAVNTLTPLHVAIKVLNRNVFDLLLEVGAGCVNRAVIVNGIPSSALLMACEIGNIYFTDKLLCHEAEDKDGKVWEMAFSQQSRLIPFILKHKSVKDTVFTIDKKKLRQIYIESLEMNSDDECTSNSLSYRQYLPTSPVFVKWQNLKFLTVIEKQWLVDPCYLHNPAMRSINNRFALYAITRLDVSNNCLTIVPAVIFNLPSLCSLNLSHNKITEFPKDRSQKSALDYLEDLHIHHNKLKEVPSYVFRFPSMKVFNASCNEIERLPSDVWVGHSLVSIDVSHNSLQSLPSYPGEGDFTCVSVSHSGSSGSFASGVSNSPPQNTAGHKSMNDSTVFFSEQNHTLTPSIDMYHDVQHVNYWIENITLVKTDPNFSQFGHGLKVFNAANNKVTEIPKWLACCAPQLETLNLSSNNLESISRVSHLPHSLLNLDLSDNRIQTICDCLDCDELENSTDGICYSETNRLYRSASVASLRKDSVNKVSCSHRVHKRLDNLVSLVLARNKLQKLIVAKPFRENENMGLTTSTTTVKSISTMPDDEIEGRLLFPNLKTLDVSSNEIKHIQPDTGSMKELSVLILSKNPLKELPPELGKLSKLWRFDLDGCNIEGPIQDYLKNSHNSARDIVGFLDSVLEESTEFNCMNLMLVGVHNIGKTSLLEKLQQYSKTKSTVTHFNDRMDMKTAKKPNKTKLSTVGIDMNELVLNLKKNYGAVTFRTWDFGGQKEYYATHQYFLSSRSLYLVLWKLTDGEQGIQSLFQWLVNIQARAPSAPVIIVGTHLDEFKRNKRLYGLNFEKDQIKRIEELYLQPGEAEKYGLPNIVGIINVNCSGRCGEKIKVLVDMIYDTVFELKNPRKRLEKMLRHKIPKKYLVLKDIVLNLAQERRDNNEAPVLTKDYFLVKVIEKMNEEHLNGNCLPPFRNSEDLKQAADFLHENGILFHYDDPNLRNLYFLDPQWLCDQLTQVVAVPQVNPVVRNGIMNIDHLKVLFKNSLCNTGNFENYILSLLSKFELAMQFDKRHLILPSLLPTEKQMPDFVRKNSDARICLKPLGQLYVPERVPQKPTEEGRSKFYIHISSDSKLILFKKEPTYNSLFSYCRLYLLTYFPSGFWPRLITRILADGTLYDIVLNMICVPPELLDACDALTLSRPQWRCWQTGMELVFYDSILFRIKEIIPGINGMCDYGRSHVKCCMDEEWLEINTTNASILEINFPVDGITFYFDGQEPPSLQSLLSRKQYRAFRDETCSASFLAKITEHVDGLLQDWYPELGESRFLQDCNGRYLVTRLIPCPFCLKEEIERQKLKLERSCSWEMVHKNGVTVDVEDDHQTRKKSNCGNNKEIEDVLHCFLLEGCILNFLEERNESCPRHKSVSPVFMTGPNGVSQSLALAPDIMFNDLDSSLIVNQNDELHLLKKLGEGAFGEVYAGRRTQAGDDEAPVAVKVLYTQDRHSPTSTQCHLERACCIYVTARQELSILMSIKHAHIVSLVGLGKKPLSLLLDLAPLGSLKNILDKLNQDEQKLTVFVIKQIVIQVADALAYLHRKPIIHRDLKADNVLVWYLPLGNNVKPTEPVHVRLADYGISRTVAYSGAKGFCGTPPFIAPEILKQTGRSSYDEKVDIFSFGMFMYELLTCVSPLENIANLTMYVCQGGRPAITEKEECWPSHLLDLMGICWSQTPENRPTAETIQKIASCQEFCHLVDAISLSTCVWVLSSCSTYVIEGSSDLDEEVGSIQIWLSTTTTITSALEIFTFDHNLICTGSKSISRETGCDIAELTVVNKRIWSVDVKGNLQIYRARDQKMECQFQLDVCTGKVLSILHCEQDNSLVDGNKVVIVIRSVQGATARSTLLYVLPDNIGADSTLPEFIKINSNCSSVAYLKHSSGQLWLGQNKGQISVYSISKTVKEIMVLDHFNIPNHNLDCRFLVTSISKMNAPYVWSYNYPGTFVYRWNSDGEKNPEIEARIDCSRIVPSRESQCMNTQNLFEAGNYQVTAMCVAGGYLYIGTTLGCIIVANAISLTPCSVFRCHGNEEFYIRAILPLFHKADFDPEAEEELIVKGISTIGRGYVDIFREIMKPKQLQHVDSDDVFENLPLTPNGVQQDPYTDHTFILTWSASNWEYC